MPTASKIPKPLAAAVSVCVHIIFVCVPVFSCVRARMRACVRANMPVTARARVHARACMLAFCAAVTNPSYSPQEQAASEHEKAALLSAASDKEE